MGFLFRGRFAQVAEFISILLILIGIVMLCQPFLFGVFQKGFGVLLTGWIGLNFFSHRKPIREVPPGISASGAVRTVDKQQ